MMPSFATLFLMWAGGLFFIFLPIELYAATATPTKTDTFSEFVWWAFGVKPRGCGLPVRFRALRRFILGAFLFLLYLHLVFAVSYVPLACVAPFVAAVIVYALVFERKQ